MALKYLCDLNINDNVLQNARVLATGTAPTALIGAIYVDTGDSNKLKYHNGSGFIALGTGTATGDLTGIDAGAGLTGTSLSGPVPVLNVGAGTGITVNVDDVAVSAAQTGITSIYNTSLVIGYADSGASIDFGTDDKILFEIDDTDQFAIQDGAIIPATTNDIDLGSSTKEFKDAYFDGVVTSDSFVGPLTGNASTATKISSITNSNIVQLTSSQTLTNKTLTSPTLTTPALGTPASGTLTNCTFPTLNQNTTGSAATLTTARAINGVDFDGSAAITVTADAGTLSGTELKSTVVTTSATSVGALDSGSITTGFGNIDVGTSSIAAGSFDASDGNITNVGSISLDAIIADGSAITIGTDTSGDTVTIGHSTSEVTIGDNLTVSGDLTVNGTTTTVDSTTVAIGDNMMKYAKDNTANSVDIGWYGKAVVSSANKFPAMFYDASSGITSPEFMVGIATTEPGSTGSIAVKGTVNANLKGDVDGNAATATKIASVTNSNIVQLTSTQTLTNKSLTSPTITGTGTIAGTFTGNVTGDVTGKADTADALETARNIGGVSFDGSANINLPGVNAAGDQDTTGNAATATKISSITNSNIVQLTSTQTLTNKTLTSPTLTTPALGTPASGTLTNCSFPTLNQNTSGSAATLGTGRTIAMTGDVAWTSASFDGSGNVTGTSTIQSGAVENSMLDDLVKGFAGSLTSGTSGIARTTPTGKTVYTCTVATMYATGADGRKCMVEVVDGSTYATVYPCITRDGNDVVITFNGTVNNGDYRIMMKQVG